jgi:helicase required for RNAi-mediated heterochromatin assembly 1
MLYPSAPDQQEFQNIDLIKDWPTKVSPVLDASQYDALRRILTKELAIIQGPPGTGKTHVSVFSLSLLLRNRIPKDPPIIVAAHTNHAVDQLLRHVSVFDPDFIRLGGRTTDIENIRPRTLYEIKKADKSSNPAAPKMPHLGRQKQLITEMTNLLKPLNQTEQPFSSELFMNYGLITLAQYTSLQKGAAEWVRVDEPDQVPGDISMWLGRDLLVANVRTMPEEFGIEIEEVDLEFEQLKEMEAESKLDDDDAFDVLRGPYVALKEPFVGRKARGVTEETVKNALLKQDMWAINESHRGAVYEHLQQRLKDEMLKVLRKIATQYAETVIEARIGRWEVDATYLRKARIIGMTTTGLSKYRGLIDSLKPKIVMIEEAAETLEAYVTAACFDSLEHLILVGDHQQLRGHCNVQELEGAPWNLDVSMFERLVQNNVGHSQMIKQRRMIPEIRRALKPIYKALEDHESVLNRPSISGMGGVNTFFFSHDWPESSDMLKSKINEDEANMVVGFFDYLVMNGMETKAITVLTFYNGQRKLILRKLRNHPNLQGCFFKVVTVDSYQGEENEIVLLSLVRNNANEQIGFLSIGNRVCVALSRAQRGFYLFGNSQMLCFASNLWWDVIQVIGGNPNRVGFSLPICCEKHQQIVHLTGTLKGSKASDETAVIDFV